MESVHFTEEKIQVITIKWCTGKWGRTDGDQYLSVEISLEWTKVGNPIEHN